MIPLLLAAMLAQQPAYPPELPPIQPTVTFFGFHTLNAPQLDLLPAPAGQPLKLTLIAPQQTYTSQADMDAACAYFIQSDNIVYAGDPKNPTRLQLAGCHWLSTWTAPNNMTTELGMIQGNTVPGYNLVAMRDADHGDLVVLIDSDGTSCGLGYMNAAIYGKAFGFSVVYKGCAPADGNLSMVHERGHNLGLCHDDANASGCTPYAPDGFGFCDSAHGRRGYMVYPSPCGGSRVKHEGDTDNTDYGYVFGDATHNGERILRLTMPIVANFYPPVTAVPAPRPAGKPVIH